VPTIYQRVCVLMVGTLRFAHPTNPAKSYDSRSFRTCANTLRNISGVSTRVFVL
jgi:hypothetical protein